MLIGTILPPLGALFAVGCALAFIVHLKRALDAEDARISRIRH